MDAAAVDSTQLLVPIQITAPLLRGLKSANRGKHLELIRGKRESASLLDVQRGVELDFSALFTLSFEVYDQISTLNPNLELEKRENFLFIKAMSSISSGIGGEIHAQLYQANTVANGNPNFGNKMGVLDPGHAEFLVPAASYFRADVSWTTWAAWTGAAPTANKRLNIRPALVVEVISPSQATPAKVREQRIKMQDWILAGVEFGIFVDWIHHRTYRYCTAASGHLPAGTPTMAAAIPAGGNAAVLEHTIPWPGLPAQPVGAPQFGPPLVVNIPATTQFPLARAAGINAAAAAAALGAGAPAPAPVAALPIGINHAQFVLSE